MRPFTALPPNQEARALGEEDVPAGLPARANGRHLSAHSGGPASSADDSPVRGMNVEQSTAVAAGPPAPLPCGLFAPGRENVE